MGAWWRVWLTRGLQAAREGPRFETVAIDSGSLSCPARAPAWCAAYWLWPTRFTNRSITWPSCSTENGFMINS